MGGCSGKSKHDDRDRTPYGAKRGAADAGGGGGDELPAASHKHQQKAEGGPGVDESSAHEAGDAGKDEDIWKKSPSSASKSSPSPPSIAKSADAASLSVPNNSAAVPSALSEQDQPSKKPDDTAAVPAPLSLQTPEKSVGIKNIASPSFSNTVDLSPQQLSTPVIPASDTKPSIPTDDVNAHLSKVRLEFNAPPSPSTPEPVAARQPMRTFGSSVRDSKSPSPSSSTQQQQQAVTATSKSSTTLAPPAVTAAGPKLVLTDLNVNNGQLNVDEIVSRSSVFNESVPQQRQTGTATNTELKTSSSIAAAKENVAPSVDARKGDFSEKPFTTTTSVSSVSRPSVVVSTQPSVAVSAQLPTVAVSASRPTSTTVSVQQSVPTVSSSQPSPAISGSQQPTKHVANAELPSTASVSQPTLANNIPQPLPAVSAQQPSPSVSVSQSAPTATISQPVAVVAVQKPAPAVSASQPPAVSPSQPPAVSASQPPAANASQPPAVSASQPPAVSASQPPAANASQPAAASASLPPAASASQSPAAASATQPAAVNATQLDVSATQPAAVSAQKSAPTEQQPVVALSVKASVPIETQSSVPAKIIDNNINTTNTSTTVQTSAATVMSTTIVTSATNGKQDNTTTSPAISTTPSLKSEAAHSTSIDKTTAVPTSTATVTRASDIKPSVDGNTAPAVTKTATAEPSSKAEDSDDDVPEEPLTVLHVSEGTPPPERRPLNGQAEQISVVTTSTPEPAQSTKETGNYSTERRESINNGPSAASTAAPSAANSPTSTTSKDSTPTAVHQKSVVARPTTFVLNNLLPDFSKSNSAVSERRPFQNGTRQKLMQMFDKWWNRVSGASQQPRTMLAVGPPASGKTTFAAEIVRKHGDSVVCFHQFFPGTSMLNHCSTRYATLWLARQLIAKFGEKYERLILNSIGSGSSDLQSYVDNKPLTDLFDKLILKPLLSAELRQGQSENMLVVISGLEHCQRDADWAVFIDSLATLSKAAPDWLLTLVTCQSESSQLVIDKLGISAEVVDVANIFSLAENQADIKKCLRDALARFMDRISLDGGLTQLATKCDSSLLCARIMINSLNATPERKVALREVDSLFPASLAKLIRKCLDGFKASMRTKQSVDSELTSLYAQCLGIIVLSREPIHESFVDHLSARQKPDLAAGLSGIVYVDSERRVSLIHSKVRDWLVDEKQAEDYAVALAQAKQKMADLCADWLNSGRQGSGSSEDGNSGGNGTASATGATANRCHRLLYEYALKHAMFHFLEAPKQQERVGEMLCGLRYLQDKLLLEGVSLHNVLEGDYRHEHDTSTVSRKVTIIEYMAKQPRVWEQVRTYERLMQRRAADVRKSPSSLLLLAANYAGSQRIQNNARAEIEEQPWIEDALIKLEPDYSVRDIGCNIVDFDLSFDEKMLAILGRSRSSESDIETPSLAVYGLSNFERKVHIADLNSIREQLGPVVRFLSDGNVFVGSLASVVTMAGRTNATSFDLSAINLTEKYSIECAATSAKYLVCAITTIPAGGRSVHLAVIDVKAKKCVHNIEVFKFKFGGSPLLGVRSVAISSDESHVCAIFKNVAKPVLKATVWNTAKWSQTASVDLETDLITRCYFTASSAVAFCSGLRTEGQSLAVNQKIMWWNFGESSKPIAATTFSEERRGLVFASRSGKMCAIRWEHETSTDDALIYTSKGGKGSNELYEKCAGKIPELITVRDVFIVKDSVYCVCEHDISEYTLHDLEDTVAVDDDATPSVHNIRCINCTFMAKSDVALVSHLSNSTPSSTSALFVEVAKDEELKVTLLPFENEPISDIGERLKSRISRKFLEPMRPDDVCLTNSDGNVVIFNSGTKVKAWNKVDDSVVTLATFHELSGEAKASSDESSVIYCIPSTKENLMAVQFSNQPERLYVLDVKTGSKLATVISTEGAFGDFTFMPHNGCLLTWSASQGELTTWNQRLGERIHTSPKEDVAYCRCSPASDRLVVSTLGRQEDCDVIVLRNSDGKFTCSLDTCGKWLGNRNSSDAMFSADGTVLVGICAQNAICRVWNAGNGELLRDLNIAFVGSSVDVVGMITNTHLAFYDGRVVVVDVSSGHVIATLPIRATTNNAFNFHVSSRSSVFMGWNCDSKFLLFSCHNLEAVKRKTTLQQMKIALS